MLDWCVSLMEYIGCSMETAMREYAATHDPEYDPADYEDD